MKNKLPLFLLLMGLLMIGITSCKKSENNDVRVTTYTPQDISLTTAKCGGDVIVTQGLSLNEIGVCWSMDRNPTVEDTHLSTTNWSEPYICTITGLEQGMTYHVRAYALRGLEYYYGDDKSFTTKSNGGGGSWESHTWVDLGLPSGTLWATCNVGASAPEECGDYFAWGETQPKDYYDWNTYLYCAGGNYNYLFHNITKYCTDANYGYNGFTDNLTTLQPMDDAATSNWGNGWCMPTREQWQELIDNTIVLWTTQSGIKGLLFTAMNGRSLFLPAAGGFEEGNLTWVGYDGDYWSGSLYTTGGPNYAGPDDAWRFAMGADSDGFKMYPGGREWGISVRPVRSSRQK